MNSHQEFNACSLEIFRYQYLNNSIYRQFADAVGRAPEAVGRMEDIPFLPIEFFKTHRIVSGASTAPDVIFESSGTTGTEVSRHYVTDLELYRKSFMNGFERFYGHPSAYIILALLPSYLEQGNSSLVYMVNELIQAGGHPDSGFYLEASDDLIQAVQRADRTVLLFGVTYALLDLAATEPSMGSNLIVLETGGMKGRRKEMIREALHGELCKAFQTETIHSEYGMTELLSQAYSAGKGIFKAPPWMKVMTRDPNDPLAWTGNGKTGGINIIDLANVHSCSFLATQDLGRTFDDDSFEVLGRFDTSDIRGCNLLVAG